MREDRRSLGIADPRDHSARSPSTYITVHRGRILEDGFAQLSAISVDALKGNVKVKFMNEQVRERTGIDVATPLSFSCVVNYVLLMNSY